jgi:hypothetical protein
MGQCTSSSETLKVNKICNKMYKVLLKSLATCNIYDPLQTGINNLQCCIHDCNNIIHILNKYECVNKLQETSIVTFVCRIISLKLAIYELLMCRKRIVHVNNLTIMANIVKSEIKQCNFFILKLNRPTQKND